MTISITESIEVIRSNIATFTGVKVILGMPDGPDPSLYLFPYKFSLNTEVKLPPSFRVERGSQTNQAYNVRFLLIPNSSSDYATLSKGIDFLSANPILKSNEETIQVILENIPTDVLTRLFLSTGITYRLSIPFEICCRQA